MSPFNFQARKEFVQRNSAHECGHMTVLFKSNRLSKLNYFPYKVAADGRAGIIESSTVTELIKEDCVALAASMIGELISLGHCDPKSLLDDRQQVQRLANQPLENFALKAYEVIKENLLFFRLLNIEVEKKMMVFFDQIRDGDPTALREEMAIVTLAQVEEVYKRAESIFAGFPGKTEIQK